MSDIANRAEPFLDWYGVWPGAVGYEADGRAWLSDVPQGVRLSVQPAEKSAPILVSDRPWEGPRLGCSNALCEEGRYRLWYGSKSGLCYAESADGFEWTKPELGLIEHEGSTANNLVYGRSIAGAVFRDPGAPGAERYKFVDMGAAAIYQGRRIDEEELTRVTRELQARGLSNAEIYGRELRLQGQVHGGVSPDGLRWTRIEEPLFEKFCDTQNVVFFDEAAGKYVGYWRSHAGQRRTIARSETEDFRHWPLPEIVLQPDSQDPPTDDYYTNGYSPYPGGGFHLMFPAIYRRARDVVDVQLAVSRDGIRWSWPERRPVLEPGPPGSLDQGGLYPGPGLLPLASDRWGLLCDCEPNLHNELFSYELETGIGALCWAIWKRDRLVALEATVHGQVTLNRRRCQGERLLLNYQTEPGGWIRVAVIEPTLWPPARLEPLPGYGFDDCAPLRGDHLEGEVRWRDSADRVSLKDREVCLRVELHRARLFSVAM